MNERIKTLRRLAIDELNQHFLSCPDNWDELVQEKVAEFIVRECVNILKKPEYIMTHPEELTDYNRGWVNGRLLGIEHIKEQLGVEQPQGWVCTKCKVDRLKQACPSGGQCPMIGVAQ